MKKSKKTMEKDKVLEEFYNERSWANSLMTERHVERLINDQQFGVFGNALISVAMVAVVVGIIFLILNLF